VGIARTGTSAGVALAVALTISAVPGSAAADDAVDPPEGQKFRVLRLVHDYFVARDKGWLSPQQSRAAIAALEDDGDALAEQPAELAAGIARIADETADEQGLRAKEVKTGLTKDPRVEIRGHTATVTATAGTFITWNNDDLGASTLGDTYQVTLEREKQTWRITKVAYAPIPSTEDNASTMSQPDAAQAATGPAPTDGPVQTLETKTYDRSAAAAYANYWSQLHSVPWHTEYGTEWVVQEPYNPDYLRLDNDCTNFASQTLHAGGWPKANGADPDDLNNWTDDLWGPYGPSTTWSVAYRLWRYAIDDKRGERKGTWPSQENEDIWKLQPGDLLFADWDPDGKADGKIDHAMVITGSYTELGFTEPTYSQHSPVRNNLPLSIGIKIATAQPPPVDPEDGMGGQGRTVVYYPVHIKDTFTTD
jgi:hypothetical protein